MRYFPSHLNIETSDYCNRSCDYCPIQHERGAHAPRLLSLDLFTRLVDEIADAPPGLKVSLQWIDEPLSNPRFFEFAEIARARAPHVTWLLQSNGDKATAENVARLKSIFDGISFNLYTASAAKAWAKKDLPIALRPVNKNPRKRISHPGRLQRSDDEVAAVHVNEKFRHDGWIDDYSTVQMSPDDMCSRPWEQAAIGYDGQVYLCCRDNLKAHPVGNLSDMSLYEAYNTEAAQTLRGLMQAGRRDRIRMCHMCPKAFNHRFVVIDDEVEQRLMRHARGDVVPLSDRVKRRPAAAHFAPERAATDALPALPAFSVEDSFDDGTATVPFATSAMPHGDYDYLTARRTAAALGHVVLPGILPRRYEYVVGLTPQAAGDIVEVIRREVPDDAFIALYVCGSRIVTRTRLYALDPKTFDQDGGLPLAGKTHIREYGPDPRKSSDLDIKLLVDETVLDEDAAAALSERLGPLVEPLAPDIPLSGHHRPLLKALRVPAGAPHDAFRSYNQTRPARIDKCALSLEYVQLLASKTHPAPWTEDVRADVAAALCAPPEGCERMSLDACVAPRPETRDADWLRSTAHGLSGHQLTGALLDFPALEPRGVVVENGQVVAGHLAICAARQAQRTTIAVNLPAESNGA